MRNICVIYLFTIHMSNMHQLYGLLSTYLEWGKSYFKFNQWGFPFADDFIKIWSKTE